MVVIVAMWSYLRESLIFLSLGSARNYGVGISLKDATLSELWPLGTIRPLGILGPLMSPSEGDF